ncbi:hypothetical protein [Nitrosopumilus sp.]|uniref:hypothetical protein n=1 Tax=Nitrosopumilus sp. TaxID=2024843 RepID=UPI00262916B5|nr:hypothetical protein [Nitrosopumilus sp.]
MFEENNLIERIIQIKNLKENCFKYLDESSKDLLTHKIIFSIAKLSSEKMGPVKIAEISKDIFGEDEKSKKDLIRLGIEKSLSKCGMVEKLQYATNDVRYLLTAYRFQRVKEIESFRGDRVESFNTFEIPKSSWPIPDEFYKLLSKKFGYDEALKKINADFDHGVIPRGEYEDLIREYSQNLTQIQNKIHSKFEGLEDLVN